MTPTQHKSKSPAQTFMRYHNVIQKCMQTDKLKVAAVFAATGYNKALIALNTEVDRLPNLYKR